MKLVEKILKEAKQVGLLYHYTSFYGLIGIVKDNVLKTPYVHQEISLTRNKDFHKHTNIINCNCRITIDGDKLSNHYKIVPFQYTGINGKMKYEDQFEEQVLKPIVNIKKYV